MPLTMSKVHDISAMAAASDKDNIRYCAESHRLVATNGNVAIAVPVDGNSVPSITFTSEFLTKAVGKLPKTGTISCKADSSKFYAGDTKTDKRNREFPDVASAWPETSPELIAAVDPGSLKLIVDYAVKHAIDGEPLYIAVSHDQKSDRSSGLERVDGPLMMFCVVNDAGQRKLVSSVVCQSFIPDDDCQRTAGLIEVARKPRTILKDVPPSPSPKLDYCVRQLKAAGYSVAAPGETPIQTATATVITSPAVVRINPKSSAAKIRLREVACEGDMEVFDTLIAMGVDPNFVDHDGNHLLLFMAADSDLKSFEHALAACQKAGTPLIDKADPEGWTPLMYAASNDGYDIVKLLKSYGAKVTAAQYKLFQDAGGKVQKLKAAMK